MTKRTSSFYSSIVGGTFTPATKATATATGIGIGIAPFFLFLLSCWCAATTTGLLIAPSITIPCRSRSHSCYHSNPDSHGTKTTKILAKNKNKNNDEETQTKTKTKEPPAKRELTSLVELESCWNDADNEAPFLSVRGDTQIIGSPDHPGFVHPVVRVLHDRKRKRQETKTKTKTKNEIEANAEAKAEIDATSRNDDGDKIALVIEGGGMRGCVTAGMVCAIDYLGLRECVDIVYGSSAGSIIGAYFVTGQLPWVGPEVYYDQLPSAGKSFIDTGRLLRALGIGLLNPKLLKDTLLRRNAGKPLIDLDFLLKETMQNTKPLNWEVFAERQRTNVQPLKIIASCLKREEPLVMTYEDRHFESLEELAKCMHASSLLPGIAGPAVNIRTTSGQDEGGTGTGKPKFVFSNNCQDDDYEPLADALVYAPIAYEAAMAEGATHMVVLRSKPDGGDVIGKGGNIGEKLIWSRFFLRKNKLPNIYKRLRNQLHKKLYAKNVLELNDAAREGSEESSPSTSKSTSTSTSTSKSKLPPTLTVAIPSHIAEVPRLEVGRPEIFEGVRDGFARAYDALVEDPSQRGRGYEVAKQYFPDEILDYTPKDILALQNNHKGDLVASAFETYLERSGVWPKAWEGLDEPPLGYSSDRTTVTRKNSSSSSSSK